MFTYNNAVHGFIRMTLMKIFTRICEDLCINVNMNSSESETPNAKKKVETLNVIYKELKKALKNTITAQKK